MPFINLVTPKNINSGIGEILFLAPLNFFSSLKKPEPPFLFSGAEVMIFDTHEFKDDRSFLQLALAQEKNDLVAKATGDTGAKKFVQDIKCVLPGSYPEQHELIKNLLNTPLIALAKDSSCDGPFFYQLGNDDVPAYISTDFSSGTTKEGIKGYNLTISATHNFVQLYTGQLVLEAAIVLQTEDGNILVTEDGSPIEI